MPITTTTLAGAVGVSDTLITVASATGITAPNFQTGTGITILMIDQEQMLVMGVNGVQISVLRGQGGSVAVSHTNGSYISIGLPTDFIIYTQILQNLESNLATGGARKQKAINLTGSADALTASSAYYVIKTAGVDAITIPTPIAGNEGNIIEIWSDTANAHTVTCPTTNFEIGAAANKTICTFPARPGAGIALRVCNLNYHLMYTSGTGTNSGPVVWT